MAVARVSISEVIKAPAGQSVASLQGLMVRRGTGTK